MDIVYSVNGVPIRMTAERWFHITLSHDDLNKYYEKILETVENPDCILAGYGGTYIAVRGMGKKRYLCVIYKELAPEDGFIVSSYFTSQVDLSKRIWP